MPASLGQRSCDEKGKTLSALFGENTQMGSNVLQVPSKKIVQEVLTV